MTRDEAIMIIDKDYLCNGKSNRIETILNRLFDGFETELAIATSEKTCAGCIHKPKEGENYLDICGTCSRFYGDGYEEN